ncbi:hypothetical protein K9U40_19900 [Xanthobacter autotrophicus]|uniref:hypothetical protein n=1 Tax=Xanthobacter TaxID=279 RepID=UPI0024AA3C73|nr:hypothetical protein [Xanthobacter autotrophicus]MDI4666567.1 hypothetical protein [Xanthobacter autotrophicus]
MALTLPRQMDDSAGPAARRPDAGGSEPAGSRFGRGPLGVRLAVAGSVAVAVALFAAAALLWARHGATVFFDLMSAGIAACL